MIRGLVDPGLKPDRKELAPREDSVEPELPSVDRGEGPAVALVDERRALTKFLLAVYWTVESEVVQVAELLEQWKKRSLIVIVSWITHPTRQSTKIHGGPTLKGDR